MVKPILLNEISVIPSDASREKRRFLELCAARVVEAVRIFAEIDPEFDYRLAEGRNPQELQIRGSQHYDAEVSACGWCYIDFISTNDKNKSRVQVNRANRKDFILSYRGQKFVIHYGKIPSKKSR